MTTVVEFDNKFNQSNFKIYIFAISTFLYAVQSSIHKQIKN